MSEKKDGGPAYPRPRGRGGGGYTTGQKGISLRDWFAGMAMQAIVNKLPLDHFYLDEGEEKELMAARGAYAYADAMIKER